MRKIISLTFAALVVICASSVADFAQTHRYGIDRREARQQGRIRQGIRSGELTSRETYRLERQQAKLRLTEARFRRSGGRLTASERARLQRQENRTSRTIYRQKHDRQDYARPRRRL